MRRLKVHATVGGLTLLVVVGTGGPAKAAHRGTNGRISFAALPAGQISTMDADAAVGGASAPLTSSVQPKMLDLVRT